MIAVDSNVLAYSVNRFAPEHARAARVVEDLANGPAPWAIPWPAVHAFLAFVTHPHAVARPLQPADAWSFIDSLRASSSLRLLGATDRHAAVLSDLIATLPVELGALVGLDTAAVLREHGVRDLLTADRQMRRFSFLTVRDPVHGEVWTPEAKPARRYRRLSKRVNWA